MHVIRLSLKEFFSLDITLSCGQVFRWDRQPGGWWIGIVGDRVIRIRQEADTITYEGAPAPFIRHYFSLDVDLDAVIRSIGRDPVIRAAIERCRGLRIVRQPAWECLVSYICATNSNIPMIRRRIARLAQMFGRRISFKGSFFYTFPDPSAIAGSCRSALSECKLGYRSAYVFETACTIADDAGWEDLVASHPYEQARSDLMRLRGVGPKAADCILLFAFQKYEAFPVDVWIRRIMRRHYLPQIGSSPASGSAGDNMIRRFAREYFGEYCGYAQEYLFAAREE